MKVLPLYCLIAFCVAATASASSGPGLYIPDRVPGLSEIPVAVPVIFAGDGSEISALLFSVDYDEACLSFDNDDADGDGLPDDIVFSVPGQFSAGVTYQPNDIDGELDFVVADFGLPFSTLPDGPVVHIILTPTCEPDQDSIIARVGFSDDPTASFGDINGQGVEGNTSDGSIEIHSEAYVEIFADGFESGDTSAWSSTVSIFSESILDN